MRYLSSLVGSLVLVLAGYGTSQAAPVEKAVAPVQTGSGKVAGMVLPSGVKAWFGVPFAKPPTGDLRWQPPQPISWKGVWNADRKMPECMQVLRPHDINHYFGEEADLRGLPVPEHLGAGQRDTALEAAGRSCSCTAAAAPSARPAWPATAARTSRSTTPCSSTSTTASACSASSRIRNCRRSRAAIRATTPTSTRTPPSSGCTTTSSASAAIRRAWSSWASRPAPARWCSRPSARCRRDCSAVP